LDFVLDLWTFVLEGKCTQRCQYSRW